MLGACGNSGNFGDLGSANIIPNAVLTGGKTVRLPKEDRGLTKKETELLLAKVRANEVNQARNVRIARRFILKLNKKNKESLF